MIYKTLRCLVCADRPHQGTTTREPTEEESRAIAAFLESDESPGFVGVWPVPNVGDVWFMLPRPAE